MAKYKICPTCGEKNEPTIFECTKCETDLTRSKILDDEVAAVQNSTVPDAGQTAVRICECGEKNPVRARKCTVCGEDVSDIAPTLASDCPVYTLTAIEDDFVYVLSETVTIGRENKMSDYLSGKSYVSRAHAKLSVRDDGLYIENLSGTNFTYVNNIKLSDCKKLNNGDEIGLGGAMINDDRQPEAAYFIVRIS